MKEEKVTTQLSAIYDRSNRNCTSQIEIMMKSKEGLVFQGMKQH